jgi:uncharacterized membrane protein YfhO
MPGEAWLAGEGDRREAQAPAEGGQRPSPAAGDRVTVVEYEPETIQIKVSTAAGGLLVLADSYYPGWRALVDGKPAPVLRVDYLFRAVPLPAGEHEVSFYYEPDSLRLGAAISAVALAVILGGLAVGRRFG